MILRAAWMNRDLAGAPAVPVPWAAPVVLTAQVPMAPAALTVRQVGAGEIKVRGRLRAVRREAVVLTGLATVPTGWGCNGFKKVQS